MTAAQLPSDVEKAIDILRHSGKLPEEKEADLRSHLQKAMARDARARVIAARELLRATLHAEYLTTGALPDLSPEAKSSG
jgi:Cdc6-like AAA superfamily ATPase